MKFPDDITEFLKRKFKNNHKEWLKETSSANTAVLKNENAHSLSNESFWPLEINLEIPTEQEALNNSEGVRSWISAWNKYQSNNSTDNSDSSCGNLIWIERRWRSLGTQSVPAKLILENPNDIAKWIGEEERWSRAAERFKLLVERWSSLIDVLPKHFDVLADYNDSDYKNLCEILSWLCANPNSNLYIRQVPVAGIDSKWLESRKGLVSELMASINVDSGENDFYKLCGIRPLPNLIRIRILDKELRNHLDGLGDISAPLEYISELTITPTTVFIIENLQTGLAFEDMTSSVVIMSLGYGVEALEKIKWLHNTRCIYWGDIDTHGFAILSRARSYLPKMESVLMDEATLLSHKELWVVEKPQAASAELPNLTADEQKLFQALKNNTFGQNVRLEQERIRWDYAWDVLKVIK